MAAHGKHHRFAEESKYTTVQFEHNYPEGIENLYWTDARNRILLRALQRRGLDRKKLLEIGCGKGVVVRYLRARGVDCHGCELSDVVPYAGLEPYVHAGVDALELDPAFRGTVEVIGLFDVIEHIHDDAFFLRRLAETFTNARTMVITVPSRREIWSNYDDYYGHLRRYDLPMVDEAARAAGFRVASSGYLFHSLYPPALLVAQLKVHRETKVENIVPKGPVGRLAQRMIARFLVAESALLPKSVVGTTILAVIERA